MAAPVVSVSLDKSSYPLGATITATVTYSDADAKSYTGSVVATDAEGNRVTGMFTFAISDPVGLTISDSLGMTWTKISDTGSVAVFTANVPKS